MAEPNLALILQALQRAAATPEGTPLLGAKSSGLFTTSATGKKAAQHALDQAWLNVLRTESRGKTKVEWAAITDAGMTFLLGQVNPRAVLAQFTEALDARRRQLDDLHDSLRAQQSALAELRGRVDQVLAARRPEMDQPEVVAAKVSRDQVAAAILESLNHWHAEHALGDCPLPQLFRACPQPAPSIGQFHDAVRRLRDNGAIYLHPWTGPLYELPEPSFALLTGHEIAYYASPR